jgi:hypothetical protein
MRQIRDKLDLINGDEIKDVFLALQEQNFILSNTITNLLKEWGKPQNPPTIEEVLSQFGISFETKD